MRKILVTFLVVVLTVVAWVVHLLWSTGQFKTIEPHFSGTCRTVPGVVGAEDITIHPGTGVAYISVCDRRAFMDGQKGHGGIYAYELNEAQPVPVMLTSEPGPDFQPHGIGLFVNPGGQDVLFVINHSRATHTVEVYDINAGRLIHRQTLSDPELVSPNDIAAVGRNRFYVTNDHRYRNDVMRILEDYLKLPLSNVVYFDGNNFSEMADGFSYANGINVSPDGRKLYVAATTRMVLHVYDRDKQTGKLTLKENIRFDTGLDNIEIGPSGTLWIGSHPQLLKFVAHSKDAGKLSPSQVLRVELKDDGEHQIDEVYLNNGEELSGSSVGAVYRDRLLIGSVFEEKILDCRLDP